MEAEGLNARLLTITGLAAKYCSVLENAEEYGRKEFVTEMTSLLPRLYLDFSDPDLNVGENDEYYAGYVDEDYYDSVRRKVERILGADDIFLETFEEDMKYSETPVSASISESLADIFQPLYNFVSIVKDSEGADIVGAYGDCRENFESYWGQTLCNVMRPLNTLKYSGTLEDDDE